MEIIYTNPCIASFHHMPNTLPASAAITTQNLIGFLCFIAIYIPMICESFKYVFPMIPLTPIAGFVPPHQIRKGLYPSFIMICACFIGLLAWSLHANGGTGNLVSPAIVITRTQKAFRMVQCISSVGGSWGKIFLALF